MIHVEMIKEGRAQVALKRELVELLTSSRLFNARTIQCLLTAIDKLFLVELVIHFLLLEDFR